MKTNRIRKVSQRREFVFAAALSAAMVLGGCTKKVAVAKPPAPVVTAERSAPVTPAAVTPASTTRVDAATARPGMPDAATRKEIQTLLDRIQDVYFDYDQHNLRPDAMEALKADAKALADIIRQYPDFRLIVEGYCDERGSAEYNLALGEERAKKASEYLVMLGLPGNQLKTVSYGKERPVCTEENEGCWQKNRRAHITQAS